VTTDQSPAAAGFPAWKLEDAKARFSEVVRQAREHGPQRVIVRGQDAVVILSVADDADLVPAAPQSSLAALFGKGPFARLEAFDEALRERAVFREPPVF
jgi:antitoxin Phd